MSGIFELFQSKYDLRIMDQRITKAQQTSDSAYSKALTAMQNASAAYNNAELSYRDSQSALSQSASALHNAQTAFNEAKDSAKISSSAYANANAAFDTATQALKDADALHIKTNDLLKYIDEVKLKAAADLKTVKTAAEKDITAVKLTAEASISDVKKTAETAIGNAQSALVVAQNAWNTQIAYFKAAFKELELKQGHLATAITTDITHLVRNNHAIAKYGNLLIDYGGKIENFFKIIKALVCAIKFIIKSFADMSRDYKPIETATKELATSFANLFININQLKPI
jgi:hypothetical protein